ncbi:iron-containing redox enzyme family protein [Wolbachia endosymbiont of Mansonella perstans]|nr:iron-containing redox enzyme family protein [Wolbachia endosymbiont of Mansonella perstans]
MVQLDFASGLGALYAYEHQTSEVSKPKVDGLKKHYSIDDERSLQFFTVHMDADELHSEECVNLIANLNEEEQGKVVQGAKKGAELLWGFLDGMMNACAHCRGIFIKKGENFF